MVSLEENTDCVTHLDTSDVVGLAFIAEAGTISSVAVLIFLLLVIRNIIETRRHFGSHGAPPLIQSHVDVYMLSLMLADLLQGLGAVTSAKWAAHQKVTCGSYCDAQGAIQQLGETGVAMSTLAITIHTFVTVFFRWEAKKCSWLWKVVVAFIWAFLLLFVVIGYVVHRGAERIGGTPYFSPTPYWCWIGPKYAGERIAGEYFWIWFCTFTSIVLYLILFLRLRGNIVVDSENWKNIRFFRDIGTLSSPTHGGKSNREYIKQERERNKEAMKMFWYPISYIILYTPLSINRWRSSFKSSSITGADNMSIVPTSVVLFIFGLSGLINVLLFFLTRPKLLLFNVHRRLREQQAHELSEIAPGDVPFPDSQPSHRASSPSRTPGTHPRTERPTTNQGGDAGDERNLEDFTQRRFDVESPPDATYSRPATQFPPQAYQRPTGPQRVIHHLRGRDPE